MAFGFHNFRGTKLQLQVVSLSFLTPDDAICEMLTWVSEERRALHLDTMGRLRTGFLRVMAKRGGEWQVVVHHNASSPTLIPDARGGG